MEKDISYLKITIKLSILFEVTGRQIWFFVLLVVQKSPYLDTH